MDRFDKDDMFLSDDFFEEQEGLDIFENVDDILLEEEKIFQDDEDFELPKNIQTYQGKNYYLPPENLLREYELSKLNDEPTPKLIQYCFTIAQNVSTLLNIKNQLDIDSCVNYAVSNMWATKWRKYDENRSDTIFNWFTTVLLNDMRTHKNKIYKSSYKNIPIDLFS